MQLEIKKVKKRVECLAECNKLLLTGICEGPFLSSLWVCGIILYCSEKFTFVGKEAQHNRERTCSTATLGHCSVTDKSHVHIMGMGIYLARCAKRIRASEL